MPGYVGEDSSRSVKDVELFGYYSDKNHYGQIGGNQGSAGLLQELELVVLTVLATELRHVPSLQSSLSPVVPSMH